MFQGKELVGKSGIASKSCFIDLLFIRFPPRLCLPVGKAAVSQSESCPTRWQGRMIVGPLYFKAGLPGNVIRNAAYHIRIY